jgi:hypothetical protein
VRHGTRSGHAMTRRLKVAAIPRRSLAFGRAPRADTAPACLPAA